jgi:outer membrane protein
MLRWHVLTALALGLAPVAALAQDTTSTIAPKPPVAATLTLDEALSQARANSPQYRQTLNDAGPARWAVRNAYGNFIPQFSVSSGIGYTGSGQSQFGAFFNQTPAFVSSNYSLSLQWQLDGRTLTAPSEQRALQRAVDEDITGAGVTLKASITDQYLASLQAGAQVEVARQQVTRNDEFLRLARARYEVGQATLLDVRQAEVTRGTSEVQLLRAIQLENEAKLELLRRMGIEPKVAIDQLALTDSFPVSTPDFQLEQLLTLAEEQNPSLRSLRAREAAANTSVKAARSEFLPRLFAQAGWSGFTQQYTDEAGLIDRSLQGARSGYTSCVENNRLRALVPDLSQPNCLATNGLTDPSTLDPTTVQGIRSQNSVFPFNYSGQPFQASLSVSLPIFTGFSRSLRLSQARAQQDDADENLRAGALQVRTTVHSRFLAVQTQHRAIAVQETSRIAAREQLRLAQDRYRLGSGTSLELSDAQNAVQRAEGDYVNAVYDYHRAVAALEAAVGRPLR